MADAMLGISLLLSALSLSAASPAIKEQRRNDLICLIVFFSLAREAQENGDRERVRHSNSAAQFFGQRLASREPELNLDRALVELAAEMGDVPIDSLLPRCLDERMRALETDIKSDKSGEK